MAPCRSPHIRPIPVVLLVRQNIPRHEGENGEGSKNLQQRNREDTYCSFSAQFVNYLVEL